MCRFCFVVEFHWGGCTTNRATPFFIFYFYFFSEKVFCTAHVNFFYIRSVVLLLVNSVTLRVPPLDSQRGQTVDFWSKTSVLNQHNFKDEILQGGFDYNFLVKICCNILYFFSVLTSFQRGGLNFVICQGYQRKYNLA